MAFSACENSVCCVVEFVRFAPHQSIFTLRSHTDDEKDEWQVNGDFDAR